MDIKDVFILGKDLNLIPIKKQKVLHLWVLQHIVWITNTKIILIINWNEMIFICYQSYKWRFIKLNLFFFYQLCALRSKGDIWLFLYIKFILKLSNKKKIPNSTLFCQHSIRTVTVSEHLILWGIFNCPIVCNMFFTKKFFSYVLIEIKETHACKTRILLKTSWLFLTIQCSRNIKIKRMFKVWYGNVHTKLVNICK